ncbi:uncharacterized protein LOC128274040 [Anopheles cruzii]|uniref:uncharacterized protein LOC128274040 n=1 Tax=Anopheles cruzii TaxID=68878 RepID=UPI0022EC6035|nr:uncharacterized protein LOC128274040 [Anopheles cruzii]
MRVHTVQTRRVPSALSLDNAIDPTLMDTSVPAVYPPAVRRFPFHDHGDSYGYGEPGPSSPANFSQRPNGTGPSHIPSVSERLGGYGRRTNYDENGIEVQLANGDLTLIGNRLCHEGSGVSVNSARRCEDGRPEGRLQMIKKICSFGTLSSTGSDTERSGGTSRTHYWMLMITPVVSSFSLALVIAAVVGPQWLLTEEKIPYTPSFHNTSHSHGAIPSTTTGFKNQHQQQLNIQHPHLIPTSKDDAASGFATKYTKSSLWMLCSKYSGGTSAGQQQPQQQSEGSDFQCASIDYFPSEGYSPDPNDSTNAIPYTVTHSSPFFLASNGVLIVSYGLFLVAMCSTKHKICYFISGVLFIISGLLMLIGLIMYISILKAEIGSKLRPRSSLQAPQFTFRYGQSFLLYVFGFIITELSGILNVLIYSNVQEQQEQAEYGDDGALYPTYQNLSDYVGLHYRREWNARPQHERLKPEGGVSPGPPIANYRYPFDDMECETSPRYYFENTRPDVEPDCRVHHAHHRPLGRTADDGGITKSLTDLLYTEPTAAQPAPEDGQPNGDRSGYRGSETVRSPSIAPHVDGSQWSLGAKLTRSVSTYTDLMPLNTGNGADEDEFNQRRRRTRSTNTSDGELKDNDGRNDREKRGNICGFSRQYLSRELSKEKLFNEFCKKVGPRPKPKNIYYIESEPRNGDKSYRNVFVVEPSSPVGGRGLKHRRRNSMAEMRRKSEQIPGTGCISYRHRSDDALDRFEPAEHGERSEGYYRRRDPIGRARSVDYRQTLPRNFQHRHLQLDTEPEDDTGGFGERLALDGKRVSASGLLLEPVRLNSSHGDLTSEGSLSSPGVGRWPQGAGKLLQPQPVRRSVTIHCPKYLDPPTYMSTALESIASPRQQHHSDAAQVYRSYGDLADSNYFRRPTILSPQVFSPLSPTPTTTVRSILTPGQAQHRHHHHRTHDQQPQQHHQKSVPSNSLLQSLPSPVFDLDRIELERRKSHSQLFLSSPASSSTTAAPGQYDYVNGTAV